jgi:hypothetical protein
MSLYLDCCCYCCCSFSSSSNAEANTQLAGTHNFTSSVDDIYELFDSSMDQILAQIKTNIGTN